MAKEYMKIQEKDIKSKDKDTKGLTVTKESDFSEWFTQLIQKAELIEYSPVSGCYILRPNAYHLWETIQHYFDALIKADGVKNAYFPLFIPESLLIKEKNHVEGFAPEVAWVEAGGNTKLPERLAVRPTSETIMYDAYSRWIRSHKDLPLRLNQWCNVVRWEFKHPMPFIRSREFLWQEGHTVFATPEEAVKEAHTILGFYEKVFRELCAVPVLSGKKAESEKFAGADFTLSIEVILPNGKAAQGATSHHLGQNFSKVFEISFLDKKQQKQYGWQNSWGISTRSIGLMIMVHSDDKGLVLPPKVAPLQVVVIPILFDDTREKVLQEAKELAEKLKEKGILVHLDDRDGYTPGWKYNEWEVKGVPVRIEVGPKDVEKKQAMVTRRDNGEKKSMPRTQIETEIPLLLEKIQQEMYLKAEKLMKESVVAVSTFKEAEIQIEKNKKIVFAPWCESEKCAGQLKEKMGAKSLHSPFKPPALKKGQGCFACKDAAKSWFYIGKSY